MNAKGSISLNRIMESLKNIMKKILLFFSCIAFISINVCANEIEDQCLKKQIGQMIVVGFRGAEIDETSYIAKVIGDLNIGGVILFDIDVPTKSFPRNIINAEQVKKLTGDLKKHSSTPLMIAIDAEGGTVNRLKTEYGFFDIPSHQELGVNNNVTETGEVSRSLAGQLSDLGINTNFAPVIDVNINSDNPVIGKMGRSFSHDPRMISEHARAFIEGQHEYGILTAVKHFPGHGSSAADTHQGLVDVTNTYDAKELVPYKKLIQDKCVDMIMTSHIINKNYDLNYPVTLSDYYINQILRKKFAYDGVVISDDMQMGAITKHFSFKESLIRAVTAGCDLLIISNNGSIYDENAPYQAIEILYNAVQENRISKERIHEALRRIEMLKHHY